MVLESKSSEASKFAYLSAFARVFNGIAPWLELGPFESEEGRLREKYINLTIDADTATSAKYLFSGCTNLTTVTLDADLPAVKDISPCSHRCCLATITVCLDKRRLSQI